MRNKNRSTSFADYCLNYAAIVVIFPSIHFNLTLIEFPETFRGRHIEETVKAVCVHAARNFPENRLCLCDFKEPVCREIFMLRDCTLPDVRN